MKLGDRLTFDIAGETLETTIASIRKVQWDSFQPNFFLVLPPGLLDGAAGTYMTSVYLDPEHKRSLVDLVRRFPSISIFDIDALLKADSRRGRQRRRSPFNHVFLFTLAAGITVLLAAIQATRDERRYEAQCCARSARAVGPSSRGVAAEFTALGLLAGVLGALGATVAGYFLATRLFNLRIFAGSLGVDSRHCARRIVGRNQRYACDSIGSEPSADRHTAAEPVSRHLANTHRKPPHRHAVASRRDSLDRDRVVTWSQR